MSDLGKYRLLSGGDPEVQWPPEIERIARVIVKNDRGHALFKLGLPLLSDPAYVGFIRHYIEYPEDLRVAAGPFLQERSSMARALVSGTRGSSPPTPAKFRAAKRPAMVSAVVRSLAPASVIAGRVLGFGSPHLKQGAVSWATM